MKKLLGSILLASMIYSSAIAAEYNIDKTHTNIGFKIKHLSISNVIGNFKDYDAIIDYDKDKNIFNKLEANIKVASINTENKARDEHLQKDDFFKASKYPQITFKMKKYTKINTNQGKALGTLSLAGVSKDIELNVDIGGTAVMRGVEKLGFTLSGNISRKDFNFAPASSTIALGDNITLKDRKSVV